MPVLCSVKQFYISEDYNEPLFWDTYKIKILFCYTVYCFPNFKASKFRKLFKQATENLDVLFLLNDLNTKEC